MPEQKEGCVKPSPGPILQKTKDPSENEPTRKEMQMEYARVGKPAPDFELSAFHQGGFKNFKLSDYKGKWIVICFYPGDFTFV